jgi:hypothetical protein
LGKVIQANFSSAQTVTLPTSFATAFYLWVKSVGAGTCGVTAASGNIDNESTWTLTQWQASMFYWDGALWRVLGSSFEI